MSAINIRSPELTDTVSVFEMVQESIETTYPVQGWCRPGYAMEDAKGWIEHGQSVRGKGSEYHFVVYEVDSKRLIGTTSIIRVDWANQLAQTGYFIRESERGKGLARKACLLTVEYAFRELKLHRLELLIATHNTNSMRVAEKVGAEREGLLKQRIYWDAGIFHDAYLYALKVGEQFYDEILMVRKLDAKQNAVQSKINVRFAQAEDITSMVDLSYAKRRTYEKAQPQFWRYKNGAEASQAGWFQQLLYQENYLLLVAETEGAIVGFVIGQVVKAPEVYDPGLTLMIDDFCVINDDAWATVGHALLSQLKLHVQVKSIAQIVAVSGAHDGPKRQFLKQSGLSIASEWYVGNL